MLTKVPWNKGSQEAEIDLLEKKVAKKLHAHGL